MAVKLIILRGNSGSGKSTVAKALQHKLGYGTMLIPQDVVRREIMRTRDCDDNPSIDLMDLMVRYGWEKNHTVIIEGILFAKRYAPMLKKLINDAPGDVLVYYFLLSFEETLRRHATKMNAHEFGEEEMREWWCDDDRLQVDEEVIIDESKSQSAVVDMIFEAVKGATD